MSKKRINRRHFLGAIAAGIGVGGLASWFTIRRMNRPLREKDKIIQELDRLIQKLTRKQIELKGYGVTKANKYFQGNRRRINGFVRSKLPEIFREAGNIDFEKGGIGYLSNGRFVLEWIKDPEDIRITRLRSQILVGDTTKISLEDFQKIRESFLVSVRRIGGDVDSVDVSLNDFRKRIIEGKNNPDKRMLTRSEISNVDALIFFADILERTKYHASKRLERIRVLNRDPNNQILFTFHTHAKSFVRPGSNPTPPSPIDNQISETFGPMVLFSFGKDRLDVHHIVKGKPALAFSVPDPSQ